MNGDWLTIEPNARRAVGVVADEVDGIHVDLRELRTELDKAVTEIRRELASLRTTILTVGGSFVTIILASAIGVFFTR